MGYIGNFEGWFQDMTNNIGSTQGILPKIAQNVLKGCILKVIESGVYIFSHSAAI